MYDPTGNFQIHIQRFSGLQQVQYTLGLLNLILFKFPSLKLNLNSTFHPAQKWQGSIKSKNPLVVCIGMTDGFIFKRNFKKLQKIY